MGKYWKTNKRRKPAEVEATAAVMKKGREVDGGKRKEERSRKRKRGRGEDWKGRKRKDEVVRVKERVKLMQKDKE